MCRRLCVLCLIVLLTWRCSQANLDLNNKYLENSVMRTIPGSSLYDCSSACIADVLCLSFNFLASTLECELNFNTSTANPNNLVKKKRSFFANWDTITSTMAGPCSMITCLFCEVCRVQRGTNQPTCTPRDDATPLPPKYRTAGPAIVGPDGVVGSTSTDVQHNCYDVMSISDYSGAYIVTAKDKYYLPVYCDMTTVCGGWLVFQRRMDGSVDFYRTWEEYMVGFGELSGEFWLGNEAIYKITKQQSYELRIDMEDFEGNKFHAMYSYFSLDSREMSYKLHIGKYSGDAGDSLSNHNGQLFSAKDVDLDSAYNINCAVTYQGAWWYESCHSSNLNGLYLRGDVSKTAKGVVWLTWKGYHYSLKRTEMKIRPTFN